MHPHNPQEFYAIERRFLWKAVKDMRAALRDGDAPKIVEICLDDVEMVHSCTDAPLLRQRAGAVLAKHRPSALVETCV